MPDDKRKADEHFRKGIFFYDTGKLKKAIDEWECALVLDHSNLHAKKWLLRAEEELDTLIDKHYRRALTNSKYMRYSEAISDFRIVIELSRNINDERFVHAKTKLRELKQKYHHD